MASYEDFRVFLRVLFVIERSRLFSRITNDWHGYACTIFASSRIQRQYHTEEKVALCRRRNTSEGITSCDVRYTEMETSGLVSIMAADLPDVQSVEPLEQSVLSDTPDTEVASLEASSESNQC